MGLDSSLVAVEKLVQIFGDLRDCFGFFLRLAQIGCYHIFFVFFSILLWNNNKRFRDYSFINLYFDN